MVADGERRTRAGSALRRKSRPSAGGGDKRNIPVEKKNPNPVVVKKHSDRKNQVRIPEEERERRKRGTAKAVPDIRETARREENPE